MSRTTAGILIAASFSLASCATLKNAGGNSVAAVKNSTSAAMDKMSNLLPGQGPKVVEVREETLKEQPTGHELAQAHQKRGGGFWIFGGPIDFVEPTLPEAGAVMDGSLLPPRMP